MTVVVATGEGMEGLGMSIRYMAAYFYADDGIIASNQPERLHRVFDILTGLFDWVGLRMNTRKTTIMACHPCHAPGRMLVEPYERRAAGIKTSFQDIQRRRVP